SYVLKFEEETYEINNRESISLQALDRLKENLLNLAAEKRDEVLKGGAYQELETRFIERVGMELAKTIEG
ncbi:MAG: hypothetical protein ACRD3M_01060, partial [Thermoanaerobaculia bacterium]